MSLGQALGDDLARMFGCAIILTITGYCLVFVAGWYFGDRFNLPSVTIEAQ